MSNSPDLLLDVADSRQEWVAARDRYVAAVKKASDADISPTVIASFAGVTEAAIRQTLRRNP